MSHCPHCHRPTIPTIDKVLAMLPYTFYRCRACHGSVAVDPGRQRRVLVLAIVMITLVPTSRFLGELWPSSRMEMAGAGLLGMLIGVVAIVAELWRAPLVPGSPRRGRALGQSGERGDRAADDRS